MNFQNFRYWRYSWKFREPPYLWKFSEFTLTWNDWSWKIQACRAEFDTKRMIFWSTRTHPSLIKRFTQLILMHWFCCRICFRVGGICVDSVCHIRAITTRILASIRIFTGILFSFPSTFVLIKIREKWPK